MTKCTEVTRHSKIVFEENKSKVTFINDKKEIVVKAVVDGCLINDGSIRCDNLLQHNEKNWYVELKGTDIEHALKQIANSIRLLNTKFGGHECKVVIIARRVPAITGFQKAFIKLKKTGHYKIESKPILVSSPHKIKIS